MFKALLYKLKRTFPTTITVVRRSAESFNAETGRKTATATAWLVKRAVKCPAKFLKEVPGTNGMDIFDAIVIVDLNDMPAGFEFEPADYIQIDMKRFNIQKIIEHYASKEAAILGVAATNGNRQSLVQVCNVVTNLNLESENE
jgi:hypothetical protein